MGVVVLGVPGFLSVSRMLFCLMCVKPVAHATKVLLPVSQPCVEACREGWLLPSACTML